ncbi:hypothetical protein [Gordonia sp. NB41Y]|uniref:hypothetical protein n=1 Tax=Gordonia sp. NB41Y TaxID=875808 RepID=UPI0006B16CFC|nr:hypothetical protein [Gordonia sp. NB41Y]KOY49640.1 hypothetical protein ISGA_08890 [Gordonia sp. NB41Y]WLP92874.1 hypothetical protein Q9K23_11945 [Gordonia sp. NB41Y]
MSDIDAALGDRYGIDETLLEAALKFGAALAGQDNYSIVLSIIECLVLPSLATTLTGPELNDAVEVALTLCGTTDSKQRQAIARKAQRFHRAFA